MGSAHAQFACLASAKVTDSGDFPLETDSEVWLNFGFYKDAKGKLIEDSHPV